MRKEFGMSARDVFARAPEWEVDLLVQEWNREQAEAEGA